MKIITASQISLLQSVPYAEHVLSVHLMRWFDGYHCAIVYIQTGLFCALPVSVSGPHKPDETLQTYFNTFQPSHLGQIGGRRCWLSLLCF